ncbi:EGF domain-specific O-linked N-acetylglucosamine transferase [Drosophila novamexicana]|uniref:EGF domain-specific O-linked N-acetylglucosamine transferase n=1 Tax=Drosophila novamexicana TaxID=47314 RepID=UPI0011E5E1F9|nr:EGF domain-specific O-linked N-acetylglucosamine transferase [Drosophila novamexicana]XP_030555049.1 EGF domain-specific O-linked N-acetylglucosamine transferase [Drosophila novamexicana]
MLQLLILNALLMLTLQLCQSLAQTNPDATKHTLTLPNLPSDHLVRYLNTFPKLKRQLLSVNATTRTESRACWGHERNCSAEARFQTPHCPGDHTGWVQSKEAQVQTFYYQADFGFIQQQLAELMPQCLPKYLTDSSLECTRYLRFCRGRNLLIDLRDLPQRKERIRYHMDVLKPGQILGHCELNRTRLNSEMEHIGSALQSWGPELRNFDVLPQPLLESGACDLVLNVPTFIMKIDATYNMYHHFCDFFNLYASLFVNQSHPAAFNTDVQIIIWETYPYDSPFRDTFKAFTQRPIWTLSDVQGKRVCFRNVVLPLLPRMIFGLFYNTPIIQGCSNSGLFRAFSEFILHRLQIPFEPPLPQRKLRITYLSRRTKYRQVLNENDLLAQLEANEEYVVQRVSYERLSFTEQLAITRNSDILIGMHGAGLTHLLFLPNWACLFELYNCEDPNCYKDLARLRGVHYITWEQTDLVYPQDEGHHPEGGAHAKFTNYRFDVDEFVHLVAQAATKVRAHKDFPQSTTTTQHNEL